MGRFLLAEPGIIAISLIYGLLVLILPTFARTLLDDSWNFALPVRELMFHGRIYFDPFNSAAAVIHTLWGGLFCLFFGYEFWAMRLANVVVTWSAAIGIYAMVRWADRGKTEAFLAALIMTACPVLLVTGFTFQSDMAYLAMLVWSCALFVKAGTDGSRTAFIAATVIASLSVWNKVHGLFIAPMVLPWFLVNHRRLGMTPPRLAMLIVLPLLSYAAFRLSYDCFHPVHTTLDAKWLQVSTRIDKLTPILEDAPKRSALMLMHMGYVLLPLTAALVLSPGRGKSKTGWAAPLLVCLISVPAAWLIYGQVRIIESGDLYLKYFDQWPYIASMLTETPPLEWPAAFTWARLGGIIGGGLLAGLLLARLAGAVREWKSPYGLLVLILAAQTALLYILSQFFDRYFIPLTALCIGILLLGSKRRLVLWSPGWLIALPLLLLGCVRIDQYITMQKSLWEEAAVMEQQGIDPIHIDAGYSYSGYHNYFISLRHPDRVRAHEEDSWYVKALSTAMDVKYVISWAPADRHYFKVIRTTDDIYNGWGTLDPKQVVVSERFAYGPPAEPQNPRLPPE